MKTIAYIIIFISGISLGRTMQKSDVKKMNPAVGQELPVAPLLVTVAEEQNRGDKNKESVARAPAGMVVQAGLLQNVLLGKIKAPEEVLSLLKDTPFHVLKRLYIDASNNFRKHAIEATFGTNYEVEEEINEHKFTKVAPLARQSAYWIGRKTAAINGVSAEFTFSVSFTDQNLVDDLDVVQPYGDRKAVSMILDMYALRNGALYNYGGYGGDSSMLHLKNDRPYLIRETYPNNSESDVVAAYAVPFPGSDPLFYYDSKTKRWEDVGSVEWRSVSQQEWEDSLKPVYGPMADSKIDEPEAPGI